ncbi:MAG: hypothetical protein IPL40_16480 [Proteobacteria bacterium]|nr:hypothetical protein [Pseudomonadota bacterium]
MMHRPGLHVSTASRVAWRPRGRVLAAILLLLGGANTGCTNGTLGGGSLDAGVVRGDARSRDSRPPARDSSFLPDLALERMDDGGACVPKYTECGQLCGPVYDRCSDRTLQCGGCAIGKVCNLVSHECVTPLITCPQLGAECGELRNSCGLFKDCGTCPAGKTCNANTHKCESCPTTLKCADLGFECGQVWLGCGAKTTTTDCGSCPASAVCNTTLHVCEPRCTPAPKAEICAARGAECDPVSDGCGNMVNCGTCPAGQQCGISGIGNRCSAPPLSATCVTFGYECLLPNETLTNECGTTLSCGTCPTGQVCRTNHRCGAPCTPKTCSSPGYSGKCGQQLDDGCGGKIISCGCANSSACSTTTAGEVGTCLAINTCASFGANGGIGQPCSRGSNQSKAFAKGDGTYLDCNCRVSGLYARNTCTDAIPTDATAGSCTCAATTCGSGAAFDCSLNGTSNGCGSNLSCTCSGADAYCHGPSQRCCTRATCSGGAADQACGWFKDSCDIDQLCPCESPGACIVPAGAGGPRLVGLGERGLCCVYDRDATCSAASGVGLCRGTNPCTGAGVDCCASGKVCLGDNTTCCTPLTCGTALPGYTGTAGSRCSVGGVADTCGSTFACNCQGATVCSLGGRRAVAGETGTCCANTAVCAGSGGEGGPCSVTNTCTGTTTNCCGSGLFCDAGTSTCKRAFTCDTYTTGAVGKPCSTTADVRFPRGDGTNLACACVTSGNLDNNTCVGGSCGCTPRTCFSGSTFDCRLNGQTDRCGGSLSCACTGGQVCNPTNGQCCTEAKCPAEGALHEGQCLLQSCGQAQRTCFCANPYDRCGTPTAGKCDCKPDLSCVNPDGTQKTGDQIPDGCGGFINCGN